LAIHFPAQDSHANQPKQIVLECITVVIPTPLALIRAGIIQELARIEALFLKASINSFRKRQAAHRPTGPVAAALVKQVGGVGDGIEA
jgi:hypothetical protein